MCKHSVERRAVALTNKKNRVLARAKRPEPLAQAARRQTGTAAGLGARAHDIGAWRTRDLERVTVNTKVSYDARLRKIGSPRLLA